MNTARRYEAIDGLRAFSCIGIIAMHIRANGGFSLPGVVFSDIIPSFTNLVFLFMTISAFGMCCGYYQRLINKELDIVDFYKKRYKKILPFFALLCLLDFIASPSINSLYEVFANLTLCFGLIPNADITVIGVGWFLGTVFAFYLLFPFFCFLLADKKRAWGSLVVAFIMNELCQIYFDADRKSIVFCFVYFIAGGLVFLYREQLVNKKAMITTIVLLAAGIIIYYQIYQGTLTMLLLNSALLILSINVSYKGILINGFTKFIGGISFEIYLCHMLVYRVLEKMHLIRLTSSDYINYLIAFVAAFIGAIIVSVVGKKLINKLFNLIHH